MGPVAVRGLGHQDVSGPKSPGAMHQRIIGPAEVPREVHVHALHGQPDLGRTKDVARRDKGGLDVPAKIKGCIKIVPLEAVQGPDGIGGGVDREGRVMG